MTVKPEENKSSSDAWDILVNRHGIAHKDEYKPVFEQLEKTVEKSLLKRLKHKEKRCVLLVGSNKDLIRKATCLIYCYSDTFGFYYVDCLNEKNIDDKLSQFKRGTVFLEDIDSKDLPLIKRIDTRIAGFLNAGSELSYTFNGVKKTTPQGQLIISISNADDLPQYFTSKFDVIALEPEEQTPASTPQGESESKNSTVSFDENNRYLWLDIDKKEQLEPEDARVFVIIVTVLKDRPFCRIEEIILNAYGKEIKFDDKIKRVPEYNKCKSAISTINGKYRELLRMNDKKCKLIMSEDKRIIKFSKPVVLREVLRKAT